MRGRLAAIKNIAWALGILLCLLAVFVGLLFAAFSRSSEEQFRGVPLGTKTASAQSEESSSGTRPPLEGDGTLRTLPETPDAGQAYLDGLTFLVDSTLIGLRDYGMLSGGTETAQVWATSTGVLGVADIAESKIVIPNEGSIISAANAAMIVQPKILVISVANDGRDDQYVLIGHYETLINRIRQNSPDTYILCLPPTSVTEDYANPEGIGVSYYNEVATWIQTVCEDTGAFYCDAVSSVQEANGVLKSEYASANGRTLNSAGVNQIRQYLRYHAVS